MCVCVFYCHMPYFRTEILLQGIEGSHEIVRRWTPNCREYGATKDVMKSNLRKKLKHKIRCYARERWFLLRLKSKYAGINKNDTEVACTCSLSTEVYSSSPA